MAVGFLGWSSRWSWGAGERPTVLVTAAANDNASRELAHDLAVKLGSLQPVQPASMRLVDQAERSSAKPDLRLQVAPLNDKAPVSASLVLTAVPSQAILWSKEFEQPSGNVADLKQQVAFTSARILGCAAEGLASKEPLSEANLKIYLNACAAMSDWMDDFRSIVPMLQGLVQSSPRFVPGWALLIRAELNAVADPRVPGGNALLPALRRHIAAARKLKPHLADAYLAESVLLPQYEFVGRGRLLDTAVAHNPQHAQLRGHRSRYLQSVGRTRDALHDAREAVRLDPLSPNVREIDIVALAIDGQMDAARRELQAAERLWPGSKSVVGARFLFNLRWGDPREALRFVQSDEGPRRTPRILEPFLRARIDPTSKNIEEALRHGRMVLHEVPESIVMYSQLLAEFDGNEELFDILLNWRRTDVVGEIVGVLFRPAFADIHRDPRFMRAAHHLGLLNYWRTTGEWPDFCYAPDMPYDCKAEAAKIPQ